MSSTEMTDYEAELLTINTALHSVSNKINALLDKQNELHQRKQRIESIIKDNKGKIERSKKIDWEKTDFPWSEKLVQTLSSMFKLHSLRPMQLETMNVTLSGLDTILIMPTGGGKSLCFQLPAFLLPGITLVVSPLVSLMEDQLFGLQLLKIPATLLNASSSKDKVNETHAAMLDIQSKLKILYVTPEKLAKSKRFLSKLEKMYELGRFSRLVIDEVHCCSQWGHDFRPDYKFLGVMKRQFPKVPLLGLTATATDNVITDVKKILNIPNALLFKASFNRPNLFYEVLNKSSNHKDVITQIQQIINKKFKNTSGIVYCFSKKDAETVTSDLQAVGIKTACYHADLSSDGRTSVHQMWIAGKIKVLVATVAFGMGINKPNVRFVIHHSVSKSMENLYQESGRAGRDDEPAKCVVLYRLADVFRQSCMVFAEQTGVTNLYNIMDYCTDQTRCRRSMIARHFGEVWQSTDCNSMCDHCLNPNQTYQMDIAHYIKDILSIVNNAKGLQERLTAQKLTQAWFGKGSPKLRDPKVTPPKLPIEDCDRIIALALLKGFLQEEYHFTPYTTISYIIAGPNSHRLLSSNEVINMSFINIKGTSHSDDNNYLSARKSDNNNREPCQSSSAMQSNKALKNSGKNKDVTSLCDQMPECKTAKVGKPVIDTNTHIMSKKNSVSLKRKLHNVVNGSEDNELEFGSDSDFAVKSFSAQMKPGTKTGFKSKSTVRNSNKFDELKPTVNATLWRENLMALSQDDSDTDCKS